MISVEEALARVLDLCAPLEAETVPLAAAAGRVLAAPAESRRQQPPFDAASMDGYAIPSLPQPGDSYQVVGEAAAGHRFDRHLQRGEALRIFTGAPVPKGATHVVLQEDVTRDGDNILLGDRVNSDTNIRPAGSDFASGFQIDRGRRLRPADLALLAAMNVDRLQVTRRPEVALIATGDELVMPGENPRDDQIVASNIFALQAMVEAEGGIARLLPIARDNEASLRGVLSLAEAVDMIVTIGGASVGDHDLVGRVAADMGLERSFYRIAMRPGKPLMAGRLNGAPMLGLPGNPVSAIVCGHLFLLPALRALLGLGRHPAPMLRGVLAAPVAANGARAHYMRAKITPKGLIPADRQDSALLSVLETADALLLRPPHDQARAAGEEALYLKL